MNTTPTPTPPAACGRRKPAPPHWYQFFVGECPVCGRDASYRERVYGERPASPAARVVQLPHQQTYDQCLEYDALRA
jgi:hypothetical protein